MESMLQPAEDHSSFLLMLMLLLLLLQLVFHCIRDESFSCLALLGFVLFSGIYFCFAIFSVV